MLKSIYFLLIIFSIQFSQSIWGNGSIATSDDLNTFEFNPAGLGINHGEINGIFLKPDQKGKFSKNSTFYMAYVLNGFGYSLGINKDTDLLQSKTYTDLTLGYGSKIHKNLFYGTTIDNQKRLKLGLLYRPNNLISIGLSERYNDFSDLELSSFGIAFRPLLNHHLTLGFDYNLYQDEINDNTLSPFIEFYPLKGLKVSVRNDIINNNDNWNINLGFVLDRENEFFTSTIQNFDTELNQSGFGFISSTHDKTPLITENTDKTLNLVKIDLKGTFIEEPPKVSSLFNLNLNISVFNIANDNTPGIQLRRWINQIDRYTKDKSIDGLVIKLGQVNAGLSKRQEIRDALMRFKDSGKKIYVYCDSNVSNWNYYLISMADEIYIHNQNSVFLTGISGNFVFYKDLLDKLDVTPVVYRVQDKEGKSYKGAVDTFINNEITEEMLEEYNKILDDFYYVFVRDIAKGRNWTDSKTQDIIDNGPYLIASQAVDAGLITSTMYPDEFKDYIKSLNNEKVNLIAFKSSETSDYSYSWKEDEIPNIAIIYAVGGIVSGKSNPGPKGSSMMGDKTIIKAFKDAYSDDSIDAIILRIDSGGGSALASDMMWRQMIKSKQDSSNKKPFVVSMSDAAASGGYYIATEADKIIANELTITGSIGVISFWPNFSKLVKKYGINYDDFSIKRGKHSNFKYITLANRLHNDYEKKKIQESLNHVYTQFKERVITGRQNLNDMDELDNIALGRIWTGSGAKNVFLVDEVGGLNKAIEVTKELLKVDSNANFNIEEFPKIYSNDFSFENFNETPDLKLSSTLVPEELDKSSFIEEILPIIYSDDMLMIMPYNISVE